MRFYTLSILVRNNINKKVNTVDSDQVAEMCRLIRIYTVYPFNKGTYMEERVKAQTLDFMS
jgi:hypothetical protein